MIRRSTKVSIGVKNRLEEMKKKLMLKNESEVIAYLICMYDLKYESISMAQHEKVLVNFRDLEDQLILP